MCLRALPPWSASLLLMMAGWSLWWMRLDDAFHARFQHFNKFGLVVMEDVRHFQGYYPFQEVLFWEAFGHLCPLPCFHHDDEVSPFYLFFCDVIVVKPCIFCAVSVREYFCSRPAPVHSLVADEKHVHVAANI